MLRLVDRLLTAQHNVGGDRSFVGTDRPYVHMVNFFDARRSCEECVNLIRGYRRSIEEQVCGPPQQRDTSAKDHRCEHERDRRVP